MSEKSLLTKVLNVGALGAGFYHGLMDAQGMPMSPESLETTLTWGPAVAHGAYSGIKGALFGGTLGAAGGAVVGAETGDAKGGIAGLVGGGAAGSVAVGGITGGVGFAIGAAYTLGGYTLGYVAGKLTS